MKGIIALAGTAALALAGIVSTTAAVSVPDAPAIAHTQGHRTRPAVFSADKNGTDSSEYKHGAFYVEQGGPTIFLSHPDFIRWNAGQAEARGNLWGADEGTFSLGRNVTLVFHGLNSRMGFYFFTKLRIVGGHDVARNWYMSRPSPRGSTWVPDSCHNC